MNNQMICKSLGLSIMLFILSSCQQSSTEKEIIDIVAFNEWINYRKYSYRHETVICVEFDHEISKFQKTYMKQLHEKTFTKDDCPDTNDSVFKVNMMFKSPILDSTGTQRMKVFEYCGSTCGTDAEFIISRYKNNWYVQKVIQGPIS